MYQKVTIVGNLGRDPELRYLPNGTPTVNLSVATNNSYTNQKGEQVKETTWWRVSVFGKQAEVCSQYLTKGRQVLVITHLPQIAARPVDALESGRAPGHHSDSKMRLG